MDLREGVSPITPSEVVEFDQLTPTTGGVVFTPNTPTTTDVLYVSTVNASTWIYNGSSYVTYTAETLPNTPFYLLGTTIDAGGNKTAAIQHLGPIRATKFTGDGLNITGINAANLGTGTVPTARLGSGTANSATFLRGDNTWATAGLTNFTEAQNSSAPNATVNVDSLTAVASTTDADFSIVPKGSGAFLLAVPNSLNTGGNKRGIYAVDLQMFRANALQVASGDYSVIIGTANTASSSLSYCLGSTNTASNIFAVAIGYQNTASGNSSTAMGNTSSASGQYSIAMGYSCTASANSSTAIGNTNTASGNYSIAMGYNNIANTIYGVAIGQSNSVGGISVGLGWQNTVNGNYAVAIGLSNTTTTTSAIVIGAYSTSSSTNAVSIGGGNISSGTSSVTLGSNNTANSANSASFGNYGGSNSIINKISFGNRSWSDGSIYQNAPGVLQSGKVMYSGRTTDATVTTLTTDQAVASAINQLTLINNQAIRFKGTVIGKQNSNSVNIGVWDIDGVIVRGANAGTTTLVVSNVTLVTNASGWGTPTLTANTTTGCLTLTVTGLGATTIGWFANLETTEIAIA